MITEEILKIMNHNENYDRIMIGSHLSGNYEEYEMLFFESMCEFYLKCKEDCHHVICSNIRENYIFDKRFVASNLDFSKYDAIILGET